MTKSRSGGDCLLVWAVLFFAFGLWPFEPRVPVQTPSPRYGDGKAVVNGEVHDDKRIQVDLPKSEHVKNIAAPGDGLGLCVFATMDMMARYHAVLKLIGIIEKIHQGGGWPDKVDKVIKHFDPDLKYVQYEGTDPTILDKAMARRIAVGVTYGFSERYKDERGEQLKFIYHMVMLVYLDSERACVLDDNYPGTYEWMSREEFLRRWVHPTGKGWAYLFLLPPPPPFVSNEDAIKSLFPGDRGRFPVLDQSCD